MNSPRKVHYAQACAILLVKIPPRDVGMFRFLLEARDNLALFSVLDHRLALLKLIFAPESREEVIACLEQIKEDLPLQWSDWP